MHLALKLSLVYVQLDRLVEKLEQYANKTVCNA